MFTTKYERIGVYSIDEVLPFVFTRKIRKQLRKEGYKYISEKWINASKKLYEARIHGKLVLISVNMGSHRYQLFKEKGIKCVGCDIKGKFFALEKDKKLKSKKYHFNLYGIDENDNEIMITKDHIIPRSLGGKNCLDNYQTMCFNCNLKKSNKI